MSEHLASLYRGTIIKGNAMYETIDLLDYQFKLSIADVISQIYLPIKNPGPYKGLMINNQALCSFDVIIAEACSRPDLKCFIFILNPDHSLCICINETTIAVFGHKPQNYFGIAIRSNTDSVYAMKKCIFASLFHNSMLEVEKRHRFCPRGKDSWCKRRWQKRKIQFLSHSLACQRQYLKFCYQYTKT